MAAPANVTIKDLTGKWAMDKKATTLTEKALKMQGVAWQIRKTILHVTLTLHVKQFVDDKSVTHIVSDQVAPGGFTGTTEKRELDWESRPHEDYVFGKVKGCTRWINIDNINSPLPYGCESTADDIKFLSEGWIEDESENGGPNGERHIDSFAINEERKWTARQIWGFCLNEEGVRQHVRRVVIKLLDGSETHHIILVYNWVP